MVKSNAKVESAKPAKVAKVATPEQIAKIDARVTSMMTRHATRMTRMAKVLDTQKARVVATEERIKKANVSFSSRVDSLRAQADPKTKAKVEIERARARIARLEAALAKLA